jgi:hypothetical protein
MIQNYLQLGNILISFCVKCSAGFISLLQSQCGIKVSSVRSELADPAAQLKCCQFHKLHPALGRCCSASFPRHSAAARFLFLFQWGRLYHLIMVNLSRNLNK